MTTKNLGGRPTVRYVEEALAIIADTDEPVSTKALKTILKLSDHEATHLRRGLRRAESRGVIQMVALAPDNSLTWLPNTISRATCAAHAANLYLKREKANTQIDPYKFEEMLIDGQINLRETNEN